MRTTAIALALASATPDLAPVDSFYERAHLDVTVRWRPCPGDENNAFYSPKDHTVELCNGLRRAPAGFVRFTYAHELAHAVIDQLDVPITGSEEVAADELAYVGLIATGHVDDVAEAVKWYAAKKDVRVPAWDQHQGYAQRAATLECAVQQARGEAHHAECAGQLDRVTRNWIRLTNVRW